MKRSFVLAVAGVLSALVAIAPPPAAAGKLKATFSTTTPAMWYNEMTIGAPKAQGGLGFYEEEGLEVEFTGASGSGAAVQLVGAGQADIGGHVGTAPTIIGVDQGLPVIAPWLITRRNIYAIVVPEDGRITKIADLKGQKLGVFSLGSDGVPMAKAMAREVGLDPEKDLSLVPIGLGAQAVNAMRTGQVVGSTNRLGEYAKDRPVHFQEIFATLYHNLGINPATTTIPDPTGRPQHLVEMPAMRELV